MQSRWCSRVAKISKLVSQWNLPSFNRPCPSDPSIIWRNKALTLQKTSAPQDLSEQSKSAASLAYLWPVGLQVAPYICRDTSYDNSPCDSNFLLSSHANIKRKREWLIPGECNIFTSLRNNSDYGFYFIVSYSGFT